MLIRLTKTATMRARKPLSKTPVGKRSTSVSTAGGGGAGAVYLGAAPRGAPVGKASCGFRVGTQGAEVGHRANHRPAQGEAEETAPGGAEEGP
jgi:hypothetical protein